MSETTAQRLRKNPTDAERELWRLLRREQIEGCKFRRQAPIGCYVCDFLCHSAKLVVEVDGGQHSDRQEYDAARTRWLESQGYRVIRFWNNEVMTNLDGVVERSRVALREADQSKKGSGSRD